jgi:hypothetical protein
VNVLVLGNELVRDAEGGGRQRPIASGEADDSLHDKLVGRDVVGLNGAEKRGKLVAYRHGLGRLYRLTLQSRQMVMLAHCRVRYARTMSCRDRFDLRAFPTKGRLEVVSRLLAHRAFARSFEVEVQSPEVMVVHMAIPVEDAHLVPGRVRPGGKYDVAEIARNLARDSKRFVARQDAYRLSINVTVVADETGHLARVDVMSTSADNRRAWPVAHALAQALAEALGRRPDRSLN